MRVVIGSVAIDRAGVVGGLVLLGAAGGLSTHPVLALIAVVAGVVVIVAPLSHRGPRWLLLDGDLIVAGVLGRRTRIRRAELDGFYVRQQLVPAGRRYALTHELRARLRDGRQVGVAELPASDAERAWDALERALARQSE